MPAQGMPWRTTVTVVRRKAKAQGATVGHVHAFTGERDPLDGTLGGGNGFMVDAALGTTDAVEWSDTARAGFHPPPPSAQTFSGGSSVVTSAAAKLEYDGVRTHDSSSEPGRSWSKTTDTVESHRITAAPTTRTATQTRSRDRAQQKQEKE